MVPTRVNTAYSQSFGERLKKIAVQGMESVKGLGRLTVPNFYVTGYKQGKKCCIGDGYNEALLHCVSLFT